MDNPVSPADATSKGNTWPSVTVREIVPFAIILSLAVAPIITGLIGQPFYVTVISRIMVFALAALGLNLILGYGAMVSFGHSLYIGIGAYSVGILSFYGITNGYAHLAVALGAGLIIATLIGMVCLRTSGIAFIMITLAFGQMFYFLAISLKQLGGDDGYSIPSRSNFGVIDLSNSTTLYYAIFITGSRIPRRDYEANTPIVTVSDDAIKQTGEVSVEMALQQLPQFMPDMNATDPLLSNGGRANIDLRGLGANRTLVLLDGRRMQSSDSTGVIDLNTLPSTVIQSVEVISGGASAVYGSDAIAGVVNFKTRDNFQGIELDAQYGETTRRDAGNEQFTITLGDNFADNKGNAYIALDFMKRDLVLEHSRSFFANANPQAVLPQGSFTVDPTNLPTQAAVNTAFAAYGVAPGTVLNTRSLGFNDYGGPITLFPLTGPIVNYTGPQGPYILTTPTSVTSAAGQFISLVQPLDRYAIFSKLHYDLTDNVTAYSQFYFSQMIFIRLRAQRPSRCRSRPIIPLSRLLSSRFSGSRPNPTAPFTFTQIAGYLGSRQFGYRYSTFQMLQGFKGDFDLFNGSKWNWDVYASYGTTTDIFTTTNSTDQNVVNLLTGAADGGASQGCAFNPFIYNNSITQDGTISAGCLKLLERQPKDETDLQQKEIQASLGGPIAKLPAGDVQVSLTAGFRGYGYIFKPDALEFAELAAGGTNFAVYTNASDSTKETSLEVEIPLLKDMPLAKVLNLNVAGRYSDYRSTGGTATYKADMEWAPISQFRFRGGYERALRAPNPSELFSAATQVQTTVGSPPGAGDPCDVRTPDPCCKHCAAARALHCNGSTCRAGKQL